MSAACTLGAAASSAAAEPVWQETGTAYVESLSGGQGLASRADGSLLYRGLASIPLDLHLKGWNHVGDPGIAHGHVFDACQGPDTATSRTFAVTTPAGKRYTYEHRLDPGEKLNNSFAAVSPDGQWLVGASGVTRTASRSSPLPC